MCPPYTHAFQMSHSYWTYRFYNILVRLRLLRGLQRKQNKNNWWAYMVCEIFVSIHLQFNIVMSIIELLTPLADNFYFQCKQLKYIYRIPSSYSKCSLCYLSCSYIFDSHTCIGTLYAKYLTMFIVTIWLICQASLILNKFGPACVIGLDLRPSKLKTDLDIALVINQKKCKVCTFSCRIGS